MKALALAAAVSLTFSLAAFAQDSKPSLKPNGAAKQPSEAAANIDVAAIQKKIDDYTAAIKNDPKNDKYYGARGQNYLRLGKPETAINDLNTAVSLRPDRQAYFEVRGDAFAKLKRTKQALADYDKALALGPPSHYLYLQKAYAAILLNDYESAEKAAKAALSLKQNDVDTLALIGGIERGLGKFQESLKLLNAAIALRPGDPSLFEYRAATYAKLGNQDLAAKDFEQAKRLK